MSFTLPTIGPIEYLVRRRYPDYRSLSPIPESLSDLSSRGRHDTERSKRRTEMEKYRASLEAKSPAELQALVGEEEDRERAEWQAKAKREEQARFFNLPSANADFVHWSKAAYWTLEEAIALAFGKAPEVVTWEKIKGSLHLSPFVQRYDRVRDLARRAKNWNQLFDPVMPGIFLAWARRMEIQVPDELIRQVEARGVVIADWKDLFDKLKGQFDEVVGQRTLLASRIEELQGEREALSGRIDELTEAAQGWQFDDTHPNYAQELDIALQAWRAVSNKREPSKTVKRQLESWLAAHYPELSSEARERIATVCNWNKLGGRPA